MTSVLDQAIAYEGSMKLVYIHTWGHAGTQYLRHYEFLKRKEWPDLPVCICNANLYVPKGGKESALGSSANTAMTSHLPALPIPVPMLARLSEAGRKVSPPGDVHLLCK